MKFIVIFKIKDNSYLVLDSEKYEILNLESDIILKEDYEYATDSNDKKRFIGNRDATATLYQFVFSEAIQRVNFNQYLYKEIKSSYINNFIINDDYSVYINEKLLGKILDHKWIENAQEKGILSTSQSLKKSIKYGIRVIKDKDENILRIFTKEKLNMLQKKYADKNNKVASKPLERNQIIKGESDEQISLEIDLSKKEPLSMQIGNFIEGVVNTDINLLKNQEIMMSMLKNIELIVSKSNNAEYIINNLQKELSEQKNINSQLHFHIKNLETDKLNAEKRILAKMEDDIKPILNLLKNYSSFKEDEFDFDIKLKNILLESFKGVDDITEEKKSSIVERFCSNSKDLYSEVERMYLDILYIIDRFKELRFIRE